MNCIVCQHNVFSTLFSGTIEASEWILNGEKYHYVSCIQCGFITCSPLPPQEHLTEFYKKSYAYEWFEKHSYYKKWQAKHRLFRISKQIKQHSKILDFGCGHGFFVAAAAAKGFDSFGFDIGVDKIIDKENYRIQYRNNLDEYQETDFDMITAWHVIEHIRTPHDVIENLVSRLKTGGKLLVAVPNRGSLGFKLFNQKWGWIQQPFVHINLFDSSNLSALLSSHGLRVISVSTTDTWDQGLFDLLVTQVFYKNKSRNIVRKFDSSFKGELLSNITQIVRLSFAPISYFVSFLRKSKNEGSELMIIAEKL